MIDNILSRALKIDDRPRAAAMSDPLRRRVVMSLVGQERSLTELSKAIGVELKRLHYHVTALVKIGLLVVHDEVRRAGRPIKRYIAVAEAFYVPDNLVELTTGEALAFELRKSLTERRRVSTVGSVYYLNTDGAPRMRPIRRPRANELPWMELWQMVQLSPAGARRLADELGACVKRTLARGDPDLQRSHLVHLAFAPMPVSVTRSSRRCRSG